MYLQDKWTDVNQEKIVVKIDKYKDRDESENNKRKKIAPYFTIKVMLAVYCRHKF